MGKSVRYPVLVVNKQAAIAAREHALRYFKGKSDVEGRPFSQELMVALYVLTSARSPCDCISSTSLNRADTACPERHLKD